MMPTEVSKRVVADAIAREEVVELAYSLAYETSQKEPGESSQTFTSRKMAELRAIFAQFENPATT